MELADEERTTVKVLIRLMIADAEAPGFDAVTIAAYALPDETQEKRAEYLPLITATAESLVEKGLAERSADDPSNPSWKLTAAGLQFESGTYLADRLRLGTDLSGF